MKPKGKAAPTKSFSAPAGRPRLPAERARPSLGRRLLRRAGSSTPGIVFFGAFYLFLWRWVEPHLIYHGGGELRDFPAFFWGWDFFQEFLSYPGGMAEYLAALLSQLFFHSWLGALAVTVLAWLICFCAAAFLKTLGPPWLRFVAFVLPLLMLALYSQYVHCLAPATSLASALAALCLYLRLRTVGPWARFGGLVLLSALLYGFANGALLLFALLCAVLELPGRGPWQAVWLPLALAALLPYAVGVLVFGTASAEAFARLLPFIWKGHLFSPRWMPMLCGLFLLLPLTGLAVLLWRAAAKVFLSPAAGPLPAKALTDLPGSQPGAQQPLGLESARAESLWPSPPAGQQPAGAAWRPVVEAGCLLVAAGAVLGQFHDKQLKAILATDYYAYHQSWPQVLESARANPNNPYVLCAVNQALYHTAGLANALPSAPTASDLLLYEHKYRSHWNKAGLYLDLGCANFALHHLAEAVEFYGERPMLLRRLAVVNLAIGNLPTAKLYLRALSKTPFQARWATGFLQRLEADPSLAGDDEIRRLRNLMLKDDRLMPVPMDQLLLQLLARNRENRMAFEYLMSYYLLTKNLKGFLGNLRRMDDFGWRDIPPLWQEAVVLAAQQTGLQPQLGDRRISPATIQRLNAIDQVISSCAGNLDLARKALRKDYARSYIYYYHFGR
jgi:hypothetical protein